MSYYLFYGRVFAGRNTINVDGHMETASLWQVFICFAFAVLRLRLRIALTFADTRGGHMETRA